MESQPLFTLVDAIYDSNADESDANYEKRDEMIQLDDKLEQLTDDNQIELHLQQMFADTQTMSAIELYVSKLKRVEGPWIEDFEQIKDNVKMLTEADQNSFGLLETKLLELFGLISVTKDGDSLKGLTITCEYSHNIYKMNEKGIKTAARTNSYHKLILTFTFLRFISTILGAL